MSHLILFTLGYFSGGFTALVIMGLTVAARREDHRSVAPHSDEIAQAIRKQP